MTRQKTVSKILELKEFNRDQLEAEAKKARERHRSEQEKQAALEREYNGTADDFAAKQMGGTMPVEVKTRLVNEFDAPVGDGRDIVYGNQFRVGGRAADYRFAVPVSKLPPGPYLLTLDISLGEATVTRSVQFTVLK